MVCPCQVPIFLVNLLANSINARISAWHSRGGCAPKQEPLWVVGDSFQETELECNNSPVWWIDISDVSEWCLGTWCLLAAERYEWECVRRCGKLAEGHCIRMFFIHYAHEYPKS